MSLWRLALLLLLLARARALRKRWGPDLSLARPDNWGGGRVPCGADHAVLPRRPQGELLLPAELSVGALTLPVQGVLGLPEGARLRLGAPAPSCTGRHLYFTERVKRLWADPQSWEAEGWGSPEEGGPAVPHAERLPCIGDDVLFPEGRSVALQLPSVQQSVRSIKYRGQLLSQDTWADLQLRAADAFQGGGGAGGVSVSALADPSCPPAGCPCQHRAPPEMCAAVACAAARCLAPVRPEGHCCSVCGAVLLVPIGPQLALADLRRFVAREVSLRATGRVRWWAGLLPREPPVAQLVLLDHPAYAQLSPALAADLGLAIAKEWKLPEAVACSASGLALQESGPGGALEAGAALLAVLLFLLGVVLYYHPPAGAARLLADSSQAGFARFSNRSREGSLALGISQLSLHKAFSNPMYASSATHDEGHEVESAGRPAEDAEVVGQRDTTGAAETAFEE